MLDMTPGAAERTAKTLKPSHPQGTRSKEGSQRLNECEGVIKQGSVPERGWRRWSSSRKGPLRCDV